MTMYSAGIENYRTVVDYIGHVETHIVHISDANVLHIDTTIACWDNHDVQCTMYIS